MSYPLPQCCVSTFKGFTGLTPSRNENKKPKVSLPNTLQEDIRTLEAKAKEATTRAELARAQLLIQEENRMRRIRRGEGEKGKGKGKGKGKRNECFAVFYGLFRVVTIIEPIGKGSELNN